MRSEKEVKEQFDSLRTRRHARVWDGFSSAGLEFGERLLRWVLEPCEDSTGIMDVSGIVLAYLQAHGFDGLYNDIVCGCEADDIFCCCGDGIENCVPGIKLPCNCGEGCNFHIGPRGK